MLWVQIPLFRKMKTVTIQKLEPISKILKKKWLLEILTERNVPIHKEKGFILNNINNHWSHQYIGHSLSTFHLFFRN